MTLATGRQHGGFEVLINAGDAVLMVVLSSVRVKLLRVGEFFANIGFHEGQGERRSLPIESRVRRRFLMRQHDKRAPKCRQYSGGDEAECDGAEGQGGISLEVA